MSAPAVIAPQFDDIEQQRATSTLGMWVFLGTEIMLFGGLFLSYTRYRLAYPEIFQAASRHTDFVLGTLNTAVLLVSSLTMALAVHFAQEGKKWRLVLFLMLTMLLGTIFLFIKGTEYVKEYHEHLIPGLNFVWTEQPAHRTVPGLNTTAPDTQQNAAMFFVLYFLMTGLHAVHLTVGIVLVGVITLLALFGRFSKEHYMPVEVTGLYWHLIDVVWVFLYPLLYLAGRHG